MTTPSCALVIGGSGVIGRAICQHFSQQGWSVGIHYHRNKIEAEQIMKRIQEKGGISSIFEADVKEFQQVDRMVRLFVRQCKRLDVLIFAAGCATSSLIVKTSSDTWNNLITTNLSGTFHALKAAGPIFHNQMEGAIILIGSLSSLQGMPGQAAYATSKAGLLGLMKSTAREWGAYNTRINAVFPGWQSSLLSNTAFPDDIRLEDHVLNRTPQLEEIARTVYQLAQSKDVSGQVWNLDNRIL